MVTGVAVTRVAVTNDGHQGGGTHDGHQVAVTNDGHQGRSTHDGQ